MGIVCRLWAGFWSWDVFHLCRRARDFGLFRRAEILSETNKLERELLALRVEVQRMENLTKRMSDEFLDLDLLDQQARDILGYVRGNEIVID